MDTNWQGRATPALLTVREKRSMQNEIHEECGVFGIYDKESRSDVAANAYYALFALQHRDRRAAALRSTTAG